MVFDDEEGANLSAFPEPSEYEKLIIAADLAKAKKESKGTRQRKKMRTKMSKLFYKSAFTCFY